MTTPQVTHEINAFTVQEVLLSIITVVHNDAKRFARTVSGMESFYGDERFEHVVIDGASGGQMLDLIQETSKHKNFQWQSESDSGIYDAMNKGIRLASGRFLLFLNCGDRIAASPDQIDTWLRPIAHADVADIACFCCRVHYETHVAILRPQSGTLHKMPTSHQAMVFSKEFMRTHPYDLQYRIAADFNLYLSANRKRVLIIASDASLTEIEALGVASANPVQSYKEYLQIAYKKLYGPSKWIAMARIFCKAVAIILLKKILPRTWLSVLRKCI